MRQKFDVLRVSKPICAFDGKGGDGKFMLWTFDRYYKPDFMGKEAFFFMLFLQPKPAHAGPH